MKRTAVEMGLKAHVALSSQPSLLPLAPIRCGVQPVVLVFPMGLECRLESGMEGAIIPRHDYGRDMTSPCMIRRDLEGNCHCCLDISQIPTGLMDFLLYIANRWHFLFPPQLGATGGTEEQNDPSSGAAAQLNSVPVVWVLRGRDAQLWGGWV